MSHCTCYCCSGNFACTAACLLALVQKTVPHCHANSIAYVANAVNNMLSTRSTGMSCDHFTDNNHAMEYCRGFPNDMKERELFNMVRFTPGFQDCQLSWKNNQAQGFALYDSSHNAHGAVQMIAHVQFDENSVLRAEVARKNMFIKNDGTGPSSKRTRYASGYNAPPAASWSVTTAGTANVAPVQPQGFQPVANLNDNPPCNTLFVGNLADTVSEPELQGLFGTQPGFK